MKKLTSILPILLLVSLFAFGFYRDNQERARKAEAALALKAEEQRAEFAAILEQVGGDPVKAQDALQRKRYAEVIKGITTFDTPAGQKLHYFPDPNHDNFLFMMRAYTALHPNEVIVSFAGDSEGNTRAGNESVSRHNGYTVVTQQKQP
jgi:hypothetical protein